MENTTAWKHVHNFNTEKRSSEIKTLSVVIITVTMMIVEIVAGTIFNSMALFSDGWHMCTHAVALTVSLIAYVIARRFLYDTHFTFGTWKIEILGAFTSAIMLVFVALSIIYISSERLLHPIPIQYNQALIIAIIGLVVNMASAIILNTRSSHDYVEHDHNDDLNLHAAYIHVLADMFTSVLAIVALLGAKYFGWNWLDPFMGFVGAGLILRWAFLLVKDTSSVLLDMEVDGTIAQKIRIAIETYHATNINDLHLWKIGQNRFACIMSIISEKPLSCEEYKQQLKEIHELAHVTIEVHSTNKMANIVLP